jgi:hypothetical protein
MIKEKFARIIRKYSYLKQFYIFLCYIKFTNFLEVSQSPPKKNRLTSYRKSSLRKTFSTITMSREKREKTFLLMTSESHFKYRNEYTQVTVNVHVRGCQGVKERKSLCHLMSCELFSPFELKTNVILSVTNFSPYVRRF